MIYKNIGNVYCMFKDYGKGFDYYKKAYQIRPKNDNELTFRILANLFGVCINRKDLEGAKEIPPALVCHPSPQPSHRPVLSLVPHRLDGLTRGTLRRV